ncbi:MAG: bis(5'-nucleosyl)-tetraphosphatase (symmetrical) YqeK [Clostridiales bacterium]|nr:bis(5'-nucleosyl)-tetraphosphatase (symmetrical) YqeK [Clostridiales bacterium]
MTELSCYEEYKSLIKTKMGEKRYIHSVNMAKQAVHLAEKYGADVEKAETAGILHDITKEMPEDEQLQLMKKSGIILTKLQMTAPKLWHSISGACYIRDVLNIKDEDIFNAVRYHTTGRSGMSLLEKVIFIADFTGEERDYNGAEEMKQAAEESLEKAMEIGLAFSISDLVSRRMTVATETLDAYNELMMNKNI